MLACPRCGAPLRGFRLHDGLGWRCPRGHGAAQTYALLRRHAPVPVARALWAAVAAAELEDGPACPSCRRATRTVPWALPRARVEVDACRACQVVWFDAGEAEDVPSVPEEGGARGARRAPLTEEQALAVLAFEREHAAAMEEAETGLATEVAQAPWKALPLLLGLPVETDAPRSGHRPWATWGLLAAVAAASAIAFTSLDAAVEAFAFVPTDPWRLGGLTVVTSFFLHADLWHLGGNLYFLWLFGDDVEADLGALRALLLLLVATVAGALLHAATTALVEVPCIGASGGVSGVMAYYALRHPRARLGFFLVWYALWVRLPAAAWFGLWLAWQVLGAAIAVGPVAYAAHLGGALAGFAAWALGRFVLGRA